MSRRVGRVVRLYAPLLLLLLAGLVRVYHFGAVPGGFNQDEAMAAYDAYALALYGTDRLGMPYPVYFTAWGYGQMSVLMSYAMIPFIKLGGLSVITARLPVLLVSLGALPVLYLFAKDVWGSRVALITLAFAAINPWHIMQSRWALDCNLFPHVVLAALYFLHKGLHKKGYLYLSMLLFAISMYTYGIAFYTIPLLLTGLCVYLLVTRAITLPQAGLCFCLYMALAWPIFAVMAINFFQWPTWYLPFLTVPSFPDSVRVNDLLLFSPQMLLQLIQNIASLWQVVFLQNDGLPWNAMPGYGTLYPVSIPFVLVGFAVALRQRKKPGVFFWLVWFSVALLSGVMVRGININRLNLIFYPMLLWAGLGIEALVSVSIESVKKQSRLLRKIPVLAVVTLAVYGVFFFSFMQTYLNDYNKTISVYFYRDFYNCLSYAEQEGYDNLQITTWTQSRQSTAVSEIITLFALQIDPIQWQDRDAFESRYQFVSFYEQPTKQTDGKTLYIFNAYEYTLFPEDVFTVIPYGYFGVAFHKDGVLN